MAGIRQISKSVKARCPHCNRSLDLTDLGAEMFRRILLKLRDGERVEIEDFGRFKLKRQPPRQIVGLKSGVTLIPEYVQISFKAVTHAKKVVNEPLRSQRQGESNGEDNNR